MEKYLTREKLLGVHKHPHFPVFALILGIILIADLIFLNFKILQASSPTGSNVQTDLGNKKDSAESASLTKDEDTCGETCMAEIKKAVAKILPPTKSPATAPPASSNKTSVKEYFIPFGTGSVASTNWFDVPGMQVYIDGSAYGVIRTVTFEVSINVPTGNQAVQVQLFNVSAGHPVWNSSVSFPGGTNSGLIISSPITLDPGSNLYKVQMQTQLNVPAYLEQARVHILTY